VSIAPPSDIILDVARAADPERARLATARLERISGEKAGAGFEVAMTTEAREASRFPSLPPPPTRATVPAPASEGPYSKFEAMVLATFVESTLPKNADSYFGEGTAGGVWRGMLAEQIGGQLARSGGIGIARMLQAAHPAGKEPTGDSA
jgi:hypothetical protein